MLMNENRVPALRTNMRIVGCCIVTHIGLLVADPPGVRSSAVRSPAPRAKNGSLPPISAAPPDSVHWPASSNPPSGTSVYCCESLQRANGLTTVWLVHGALHGPELSAQAEAQAVAETT